jgi:hypothetical protein
MSIVRLPALRERQLSAHAVERCALRTHMEDAPDLAVAAKFDEDTLRKTEPNEVKRFMDAGCCRHRVPIGSARAHRTQGTVARTRRRVPHVMAH